VLSEEGRQRFGRVATRLGHVMGRRSLFMADLLMNYLAVGSWMRAQGYHTVAQLRGREEVSGEVARLVGQERVVFLEFGVAGGDSLRAWCRRLKHPDSVLFGFDSFEGLPESWSGFSPLGSFAQGGVVPEFPDTRVTIYPGLFQETLPGFQLPEGRLLFHLDADLYSSTSFVLNHFRNLIIPGTVLLFDEFCVRDHEMLAFSDFIQKTGYRFRPLAASGGYEQVAFERID
jgi:O-methyltransferase